MRRRFLLTFVLSLVLIGIAAYYIYNKGTGVTLAPSPLGQGGVVTLTADEPPAPGFAAPADSAPNTGAPATGPLAPPRSPPTGYKEYRNAMYRFALFYPNSLTPKEYDEGNNARTISFENADASQGFEIFVLPYGQRQVSATRFHMDEPSGIMQEPTDVLIDGTRGTMFFGNNNVMGDTREVWFIKDGYLFEVTTYKVLDNWLGAIMQSWKFI